MSRPVGLRAGDLYFAVLYSTGPGTLEVRGPSSEALAGFAGVASEYDGGIVLRGPLSPDNARAVRRRVPNLNPQPVGLATSAGVGDRMGLATRGHARAFQRHGIGVRAVFAQQSAREMQRLARTPQQVLDDATFGALAAGWDQPVGADADHLKTIDDIDASLAAGFTSFTIDPGDHVREVSETFDGSLTDVPWRALEDDESSFLRRYAPGTFDHRGSGVVPSEKSIRRAAAKYGASVAHAVTMYRHLRTVADHPVEVEIAIDETDDVTTVDEHVYFATELRRLGVEWMSFAPRYVGRFEKGVEYIGSLDVLRDSLRQHARIASALGPYKLSLHSGSDKFSIYALAMEATEGVLHLKTSGTNYLVALELAAVRSPDVFRRVYEISREAYAGTRTSYQVSADLAKTPDAKTVLDADLPDLLRRFDSRQMLHVGYSAVLMGTDESGTRYLHEAIRQLLIADADEYDELLMDHIGRHLSPLSSSL